MQDTIFRKKAKEAIVDYWNGNKTLVGKHGKISPQRVHITWMCTDRCSEACEIMAKVSTDVDNKMMFAFSYRDDDEKRGYLTVYRQQKHTAIQY